MRIAETARLLIHRIEESDCPAFEAVFCDPEVMRYSDHGPHQREGLAAWIMTVVAQPDPHWGLAPWAVVEKSSGALIGYCGFTCEAGRTAPGEAEIAYRYRRSAWGKGYAFEAAEAACLHAFAQPKLERILGIVDPHNLASIRVLQKLGMRYDRDFMLPDYDYPDRLYVLDRPA